MEQPIVLKASFETFGDYRRDCLVCLFSNMLIEEEETFYTGKSPETLKCINFSIQPIGAHPHQVWPKSREKKKKELIAEGFKVTNSSHRSRSLQALIDVNIREDL